MTTDSKASPIEQTECEAQRLYLEYERHRLHHKRLDEETSGHAQGSDGGASMMERRAFNRCLVGAGLVLPFLGASTAARQLTPDERITQAMEVIRLAILEKNPQFEVNTILNEVHHLQRYVGGRIVDTDEPHSHGVFIFGADQSHGPQRASWNRVYEGRP